MDDPEHLPSLRDYYSGRAPLAHPLIPQPTRSSGKFTARVPIVSFSKSVGRNSRWFEPWDPIEGLKEARGIAPVVTDSLIPKLSLGRTLTPLSLARQFASLLHRGNFTDSVKTSLLMTAFGCRDVSVHRIKALHSATWGNSVAHRRDERVSSEDRLGELR